MKCGKYGHIVKQCREQDREMAAKRAGQANAVECLTCYKCSFRTCGNITANTSQVVQTLNLMLTYIST